MKKKQYMDNDIKHWKKELRIYERKVKKLKKTDRVIINYLLPHIIFITGIFVGFLLNLSASVLNNLLLGSFFYKFYAYAVLAISLIVVIVIVKILPLEYIITSLKLRLWSRKISKTKSAIDWAESINNDLKALDNKIIGKIAVIRLLYVYAKLKIRKKLSF